MNQKELEDQLQAFFEHNPLDDDMVYLKQFVKEHPENKLSWYLLGKEYALRGKQGKARYCFAQAGEVYEAFEKKKVRLGLIEELKAEEGTAAGGTGRKKRTRLAVKLAGVVIIALLAGSYILGEGVLQDEEAAGPGGPAAEEAGTAVPPDGGLRILYTDPVAGKGEQLWKQVVGPGQAPGGKTLVVEGIPTSDGKWINGLRSPALLASAESAASGNGVKVDYLQQAWCNCTPQENGEATAAVSAWFQSQEQDVILRSAVKAYQKRYGAALPETLDGVMRNFPDNLLPGYTEQMKAAYEVLRNSPPSTGAGAQGSGGTGAGGGQAAPGGTPVLFSEPLEIVVDRQNYRLALISGRFILRSYPVGLGGDKTPEGVFTITDKVKNPNGRDDGDFGSRGMQLSDTDYAIHGTKEPRSIGEDRSLGCIRMLKADIEELFDMVPSGTKVTIGRGLLPADTIRSEAPFRMPALRQETNPGKIYRWL
ncbi:MAG: ErfK/YbiS/YcfS/YnhG family protein [Paenibacillaceae bacterium]|jgi:lipoprotein-anchoring transpeptidase ErfK/SrfK|nr:ErfK/YbiS/YcfS/YnhG family protein [Paenibacillaceae bacterium]